jgi:hypothetical protein
VEAVPAYLRAKACRTSQLPLTAVDCAVQKGTSFILCIAGGNLAQRPLCTEVLSGLPADKMLAKRARFVWAGQHPR